MEHQRLGDIVSGVFRPVLAKHSKSFSLIDSISVGVDRMQHNFEPMRKRVEVWQRRELTDVTAKVVIYEGFVEGKLEAPKHRCSRSFFSQQEGLGPDSRRDADRF